MQIANILEIAGVSVLTLCALSGVGYFLAFRYLNRSVKKFTDAVAKQDANPLQQSVFQIYKELSLHDYITREAADRFKKEYRKKLS